MIPSKWVGVVRRTRENIVVGLESGEIILHVRVIDDFLDVVALLETNQVKFGPVDFFVQRFPIVLLSHMPPK